METRLAALRAQVSAPERIKFTAPCLLLHGLWSGGWMWHAVAGALARRGWECWALDLRGRPGSRPVTAVGTVRLDDYAEDVTGAARALWAPPVICGHDLGALLAVLTAAVIRPRALILLAPVLPRVRGVKVRPPLPLASLAAVPALLWGRPLRPPRPAVARDFLFNALPPALQDQLHRRLQPDSGTVARALTRGQVCLPETPPRCPVLIARGGEDRMSSPAAVRHLASRLGADSREYPQHGHWLTAGSLAEKLAADVHRWLIQSLGESLLMPHEEDV
jgi:pimeloyl-ACP methyl ester carboxylesterase